MSEKGIKKYLLFFVIPILAIVVVGTLEAIALLKGIDGKCFTLAIAAIMICAGLIFGWTLPQPWKIFKNFFGIKTQSLLGDKKKDTKDAI